MSAEPAYRVPNEVRRYAGKRIDDEYGVGTFADLERRALTETGPEAREADRICRKELATAEKQMRGVLESFGELCLPAIYSDWSKAAAGMKPLPGEPDYPDFEVAYPDLVGKRVADEAEA